MTMMPIVTKTLLRSLRSKWNASSGSAAARRSYHASTTSIDNVDDNRSHAHICGKPKHHLKQISDHPSLRDIRYLTTTSCSSININNNLNSSEEDGSNHGNAINTLQGPLFKYIDAVESNAIEADIHQAKIAEKLQSLFEHLRDYEPPSMEYLDELKKQEEERKERIEEKEREWRKERAKKRG